MEYTIMWGIWLLMFAGIEGTALFNKRSGDTLSEHVWSWFSVKDKSTGWQFRRFSLVVFMSWLLGHLAFGIWGGS